MSITGSSLYIYLLSKETTLHVNYWIFSLHIFAIQRDYTACQLLDILLFTYIYYPKRLHCMSITGSSLYIYLLSKETTMHVSYWIFFSLHIYLLSKETALHVNYWIFFFLHIYLLSKGTTLHVNYWIFFSLHIYLLSKETTLHVNYWIFFSLFIFLISLVNAERSLNRFLCRIAPAVRTPACRAPLNPAVMIS